ncbi:MAG: LPS export ABC transporter ATP-binding protein [Candidatus Binatia bacterium]|nr:LPS export ABC transporter ATP-binding protein [Candidatus Binatia bacterium]
MSISPESPARSRTLSGVELCKSYRGRQVVRNVSLEVRGGEIVGLLGPNGAGKTTTFHILVGLVRPDAGRVLLNGRDISDLPLYARARIGIGYLPQEASIFRKLTVEENLLAVLETLPLTRAQRKARAQELMEELGVRHVANNKGFELSGGERRRVEIARALVTQPHFMLLDEPFAGIDPLAILDVQQIVSQLKQRGIGVLITDHNVRETLGICDRAYILADGVVIEQGSPEVITASERARNTYLGNHFQL